MLRRAHDRSADAFASRRQRPSESAGVDQMTKRFSQWRPKITERMALFPVNILTDATGKINRAEVFRSLQCRREPEPCRFGRRISIASECKNSPCQLVGKAPALR